MRTIIYVGGFFMINKKVVTMLNSQINFEIFSGYLYQEIANYFTDEGLDGFSHWFTVQMQEELNHAYKILGYLHDNNEKVVLEAIADPSRTYSTPLDALKEVLAHEEEITKKIHDIYRVAVKEEDFRTQQFLDWYVAEQGEEEKNANDLISKYTKFNGAGPGLYALDKELGQREKEDPIY